MNIPDMSRLTWSESGGNDPAIVCKDIDVNPVAQRVDIFDLNRSDAVRNEISLS